MRLRYCLLATALVAGPATAANAQDPNPELRPGRRTWTWIEPNFRRPMTEFYRFRMTPDRMRMVERARDRADRTRWAALDRVRTQVERADRLRDLARDRSREVLEQRRSRELAMQDREFARRDRLSNRLRENRRLDRAAQERAMERVRERLDRFREDRRYIIRRRSRTI